jgi:transcription-repair coupling factor (superfamily II helicase)
MNISDFKYLYSQSEKVKQIRELLFKQSDVKLHIKGLAGSQLSFIANSIYNASDKPHLFISQDKEEAAYLLNDLENLVGKEHVLFFPSSYKRPYQIEDIDNANVMLRTEVLTELNNNKNYLIVTYPEALREKVIDKSDLQQNALIINKNDTLSLDFVNEVLYDYGFERVDFVSKPGDYAIRGGIVDVFSFSNENPYRIEFFGDDVESIRMFDVVSQTSIKSVDKITIVPNTQTANEHTAAYNRVSLIEYLQTPIIWTKSSADLLNYIEESFKTATEIYQQKSEKSPLKHLTPDQLFVHPAELEKQLNELKLVEYGLQAFFKNSTVIEFKSEPQHSFNKNFHLFAQELIKNTQNGYQSVFLADSLKQTERLEEIIEGIAQEEEFKNHDINFKSLYITLAGGFTDHQLKIAFYTDHQLFNRYHRFQLRDKARTKAKEFSLKDLNNLQKGDYVTHIDHGVGKFSGLEKIEVNGKLQEAMRIIYANNDILYVSIHSLHKISKYTGKEGAPPRIDKLGSNHWKKAKQKAKSKVKEIAYDLIKLYAKRKASKGFAFSPDSYLQHELEASFLYEDTPDQYKATEDVKRDMEKPYPMDRLVCGDVGFGKTEVAIRAAFKAVADNKQVAVLVPTTILALQHYKTFKKRLKDFPCTVDYINRFKTAKQQKETLKKLKEGKIDILIGTHRIVGNDVKFHDLGLLIIDEEQKFGVAVKDKLKTIKANVDTLTLTATPIPRTLQFSLMQARDLSVINTPPPNRQPVITELHGFNEEIIRDAITYEVNRNGQVFFIHNRVENIKEVAGMIQRLCPDVKVLVAHGQMKGSELEQKMMSFVEHEYDVLVATTIIESGLDIPNANTIIINNAHFFGLSDLHQMRGRVGRSNKKAFCYLLAPPLTSLTPEARKRLTAIEQFSDLGSGFQIAMRDLDIRGAGNLLGGEQSGFISEIGFDTYQKILNEAIQELKENEFKDLYADEPQKQKAFVNDCQIETDLSILIPDDYINNVAERFNIYKRIDEAGNAEELEEIKNEMADRFGDIPENATELFNAVKLRWRAIELGIEKIVLKNNTLLTYFVSDPNSSYYSSPAFSAILQFVQQNPNRCIMKQKETKLWLNFKKVNNLDEALQLLNEINYANTNKTVAIN